MALLSGAANLTESVDLQALRLLHAARAALNAGANEQLAELLDRAEPHLSDPLAIGEALLLRGHLTVRRYQPAAAPARLFAAALQFLPYDPVECRAALLETFDAYAISQHFTTEISSADIVRVARELEAPSADQSLEGLLLQGSARLVENGPCAAAQHFQHAANVFRNGPVAPEQIATRFAFGYIVANELLDAETHALWSERVDAYARENGALTVLLFNLFAQVEDRLRAGRIDAATACYEEALDVASAMGFPAEYYQALNVPILAWKGDDAGTLAAAESLISLASAVGVAATVALAQQALATLHVSRSRYHQALLATDYIHDKKAIGYTSKVLGYGVEAAVGVGNLARAEELASELDRRAGVIGGPWLQGLNARSQALMVESDRAEKFFVSSIQALEESVVVTELAHTRLLYGEWLRRKNRRTDSRVQLQLAHDFFASIGAEGFAERARQALVATGAHVGPRTPRKTLDLTPQELRVAQLAAERLTNAEIAAQLFISAATVDYHLRKVYRKLNIESRRQLAGAFHNEG
jgi:DNA-binding CsgD family transcriptional regulator